MNRHPRMESVPQPCWNMKMEEESMKKKTCEKKKLQVTLETFEYIKEKYIFGGKSSIKIVVST